MQVLKIQNNYNTYKKTPSCNYTNKELAIPTISDSVSLSPNFTGAANAPKGLYGKFTEWIANNYYKKFYNSKAAAYIVNHTNSPKWNNMTTHMSALGSTLISGMYVIRTLENDKLDPQRRKTLAINDFLTWGISTAGAYWLDAKLGNLCDKATTRFAANYLLDNPKARQQDILGEWHPKDLREMMKNWADHVKPDSKEGQELLEKMSKEAYKGVVFQVENAGAESAETLKPMLKIWLDNMKPDSKESQALIKELGEENFKKLTAGFDKIGADLQPMITKLKPMLLDWVKNVEPASAEGLNFVKKLGKLSYKNIRDFNLDILKDPKLTTQIDGIGVLKSLFVFGMVYRYIVPVLVMKPANFIGNYIHKKNAEKAQNVETVKPQTETKKA